MDNEYTIRLYSPNNSKTIHSQLSKKVHSVSERVLDKPIKRRSSRPSVIKRSEISKKKIRVNRKKNSLHKRRTILSTTKGLQLISIINPLSLIVDIEWNSFFIPYTVYRSQNLITTKQILEQKQKKILPKIFEYIQSAVNVRLKTSNNKHLFDLILDSP